MEEARKACERIEEIGLRSAQQEKLADALVHLGWFDEALAAARAVEKPRENDWGSTRAAAIGRVAAALARAGQYAPARAAAAEADTAATEALWTMLSIAPMIPPDGYDTEHRRHIEGLLTTASQAKANTSPEPSGPVIEWPDLLAAQGLYPFLGAIAQFAPALESSMPGLGRAVLKEATRIAGWRSATWRTISETIALKNGADRSFDREIFASVRAEK
jgi:hypothetical protein